MIKTIFNIADDFFVACVDYQAIRTGATLSNTSIVALKKTGNNHHTLLVKHHESRVDLSMFTKFSLLITMCARVPFSSASCLCIYHSKLVCLCLHNTYTTALVTLNLMKLIVVAARQCLRWLWLPSTSLCHVVLSEWTLLWECYASYSTIKQFRWFGYHYRKFAIWKETPGGLSSYCFDLVPFVSFGPQHWTAVQTRVLEYGFHADEFYDDDIRLQREGLRSRFRPPS